MNEEYDYTCIYCGEHVTTANHSCTRYLYTYESTEIQLLRQILNELQTIVKLLEKG